MDNKEAAIIDSREFDLESLPEDLRVFYAQFLTYGHVAPSIVTDEYHRSAAEGRLRVQYVARRDFYLSAETSRDTHAIELSIGVPCLLHFIFNNALRLSHVFPKVGDAAEEKPYREADDGRFVPFELPEQMTTVEALQMLPGVSRPADVDRALFASALTELACVFCVFHEVGHLIGGHAGYAARRMRGGSIKEFSGRGFSFCPRRLLEQVMEREADIIATTMIMGFVLNDPSTRQHYGECFHLSQDDERYPYEILGVLLFAAKLLFLYLAQIPDKLNVRSVLPHPLVRATYVHNALRLGAIDDLGMDETALDMALDSSTDLADRVWADLGMRVPAVEGSVSGPELARVVEREIVRLEEAHKRLQPKYARWLFIPDSIWKEHDYESP
jgi:hypothetical protein